MKEIRSRQNKIREWKDPRAAHHRSASNNALPFLDALGKEPASSAGVVYGLLKDLLAASKIAQAAKQVHLSSHNFDRAETLMEHLRQRKPVLVILDWDSCEADAFKILKEMKENADLKQAVNVGYLSGTGRELREEAQRAGCHRVYSKTEFFRELQTIVARCAS